MAITGNVNGQLTKIALERLPAEAIAAVASAVGDGLMAFMTEVLSQFRLQGFLDHGFGQLLEQTVLANEVFGLFVIGQQSAEQRFRNVVLYRCHCVYGFADPSLRVMGHLHKILYTLLHGLLPCSKQANEVATQVCRVSPDRLAVWNLLCSDSVLWTDDRFGRSERQLLTQQFIKTNQRFTDLSGSRMFSR